MIAGYPGQLNLRSSLGGVLNNQGMVFEQLERNEEAAAAYQQAIRHQQLAVKHAPRTAQFREFLSKHCFNHGRVLRSLGRWQQAAETAMARKQLWTDDPRRLYAVAQELALAVRLADDAEMSDEELAIRQRYCDRAVATLREAVDAGLDRPDQIARDPDLEGLGEHPPFRELIDEVAILKTSKRQGA